MEQSLPKGWVKLKFTDILDIKGGNQPPKSQFVNEPQEGYVRLLQIRDFGDKPVPTYVPLKQNQLECNEDDVLIARYGASIGRIVTGMKGTYNVALAKVISPDILPKNFIKWYLKSDLFQGPITSTQRTAQNGFNKEDLENVLFPLPPLAEQERIVSKLDKLFAQHEKIKKALDRIPQLLKDFRQKVLTQAVTGKLTEQSREGKKLKEWNPTLKKHNTKNLLDDKSQGYVLPEIPKEWKWVTIMQLADVKGGKRLPKGEKLVNYDTGFPYIKAGDIKNGNVNSVNLEYLLEATHEKIKNYIVNSGDILITNVGACIGDIGIVPTNLNGANQTENALKLCNFVEVEVKYLSFWLRSPIAQNYISQTVLSAGLGKLALGRIQVFPVPLSTIVEQQEIVNRVESLFAKADLIESRYQTVKVKVDNLPQAILHKAFKGELVPQLPTDRDAKELLEEIMALKAEPKGKKRK